MIIKKTWMHNAMKRFTNLLNKNILFHLMTVTVFAMLFSSCNDDDTKADKTQMVYIESNDASENSILAYKRKADGNLESISSGSFLTGGKGVANPDQILGPDDSDQALNFSADKKFLFAVNSGSNTIAVFTISDDGSLKAVSGSPFPSGGVNPVSVGFANNYLYVVNKNQDPAQVNDDKPNYTVFSVADDGKLTPVKNSTIETIEGASPAHAYVSPSKKILFGDDFLAFQAGTPTGTLRAFSIGNDGKLTPAPNTPMVIDGVGGALGLYAHPTQNVLYVGFPMQGKIGVYTYDGTTGELLFKKSVDAGKAACWIRVNKNGDRTYVLNSAESTISVFDTSSPESPVSIQKFEQRLPGPLFDSMSPAGFVTSSEPFYFEISPDGKNLYIVNQHANPSFDVNYNYLHSLIINTNGELSENEDPILLPVSAQTRPQGLVIF